MMNRQMVDCKVALYCVVRSKREHKAYGLMRIFCAQSGWTAIDYIDTKFPGDSQDSAWSRLLADVAAGQYYAVVMWVEQEAKGFDKFCEQYDTHLAVINPFVLAASTGSWRKVRIGR